MGWLTKSRFLVGQKCLKRLWLEVNEPAIHADVDSMQLINGHTVDALVREVGGGQLVSREASLAGSMVETSHLLANPTPEVLYQAAFGAGEFAVVTDMVRRVGHRFELVEVKAAGEVKTEHLPDMGFQVLVIEATGRTVDRALVSHINTEFVLQQPGTYDGLFMEQDVTVEIRALLPRISKDAETYVKVMKQRSPPEVAMGAHCEEDFPCPFFARCTSARHAQEDFPLSILPRGGKVVERLAAQGYTDLRKVPPDSLTSANHRRIQTACITGQPFFDVAATDELRRLGPPFAYLDFETLNFAVPEIVGTRPYEQCPFQWSLHVEEVDGTMRHSDYVAVEEFGDFAHLAKALLSALPPSGPVFVYNASLERGVLERLADRLPGLRDALNAVVDRLVDLWPITKAAYYHPLMLGSWSLKDVLPTIDPTLRYSDLAEVRNGGAAQLAFIALRNGDLDEHRRAQLKDRLLRYCERDTYGMVVLRRFLCGNR